MTQKTINLELTQEQANTLILSLEERIDLYQYMRKKIKHFKHYTMPQLNSAIQGMSEIMDKVYDLGIAKGFGSPKFTKKNDIGTLTDTIQSWTRDHTLPPHPWGEKEK